MVQVPGRGAGGRPHLLLEWEGGTLADMVADAAVAIMLQVGHQWQQEGLGRPWKRSVTRLGAIAAVPRCCRRIDPGSEGAARVVSHMVPVLPAEMHTGCRRPCGVVCEAGFGRELIGLRLEVVCFCRRGTQFHSGPERGE